MIDPDDAEVDVRLGADTDRDGLPDTLVLPDPTVLVATDIDRDGLADLLVRFGPDAGASTVDLAPGSDPWCPIDAPWDGWRGELWLGGT